MKKMNIKRVLFKNNKTLLVGFAAMTLIFTSCSSDDSEDQTSMEITEETAANAILTAFSPESGGALAFTMEGVAILEGESTANKTTPLAKVGAYECGQEYNTSYSVSEESEDFSVAMDYAWTWMVSCDEMSMPLSAWLSLVGTGVITGPNMAANTNHEATMSISGLEESSDMYTISSEHLIEGVYEVVAEGNEYRFTTSINFITEELMVLKADRTVSSGSLTVSFVGKASNGTSYNFSGTIEFHGNQTGTLTMESGNTYQLSW
ncbi:hypothetical protein [Zhouia amylolytica]|uniref:hypothetical protein n=1 Tax=Zhouia amylolytica TaxID=376730 RepID=UPI0020CF128D|nr:hypothetical protein [Zhouia amylolytica]MCQ0111027.1 hypothetical protein [Zhouia amylolytica]